MATSKILSLAIRTIAKPIATQIRHQAAQHESFRKVSQLYILTYL